MIAIFSNRLNNHQVHIADALDEKTEHNFTFVELCHPTMESNKGANTDLTNRSYLLEAWKNATNKNKAFQLCIECRVCIFATSLSLPFLELRMQKGMLSFDMSERWLKKGILNLFSPNLLSFFIKYWIYGWKRKPLYKLCCGGFAAKDHLRLGMFQNKCYKWGYFTDVPENSQKKISFLPKIANKSSECPSKPVIRMMWCARFLKLKHPELPILMASELKRSGYKFEIDYYGDDDIKYNPDGIYKRDALEHLIDLHNVKDIVNLRGKKNNDQILEEMRKHEIFLFTSNHLEGWGAVVNEAMANGCAVVASNTIGSVPYLIQEYETGLTFEEGNVKNLTEKVKWLLDHPYELNSIRKNSYMQMIKLWNPQNAADSLLSLISDIQNGVEDGSKIGPCSKA